MIEILRLWRIGREIADVLLCALCACKQHSDTEFSKSNGNNRESSKERYRSSLIINIGQI